MAFRRSSLYSFESSIYVFLPLVEVFALLERVLLFNAPIIVIISSYTGAGFYFIGVCLRSIIFFDEAFD